MSQDSADPGGVSDPILVRQAHQGQAAAFARLHDRYSKRLRALIRSRTSRVLAPRFDVEDVVQDVFSALFAEVVAGRWHIAEDQDVWGRLAVIALNRIRALANQHRAARRDVRRTLGGALSERLMESVLAPEEWPQVDLRMLIKEILDQSAPTERRIAELRLEEYDVAAIAARVGLSTRTVDRVLHRFRRQVDARIRRDPESGRSRAGSALRDKTTPGRGA